jgi:CBS domain-containing protein
MSEAMSGTMRRMGEDQHHTPAPVAADAHAGDIKDLLVRDTMHAPVRTCGPEASLTFVAYTMATHHLHAVVVAGLGEAAGDLPWGIVSAADVTRAATAGGGRRSAADAAGSPAMTIGPDEPLVQAARLMTDHHLTHLVVVEASSQRPVGILSTLDVTRAYAGAAASP